MIEFLNRVQFTLIRFIYRMVSLFVALVGIDHYS
jgi:hypothetical protein